MKAFEACLMVVVVAKIIKTPIIFPEGFWFCFDRKKYVSYYISKNNVQNVYSLLSKNYITFNGVSNDTIFGLSLS